MLLLVLILNASAGPTIFKIQTPQMPLVRAAMYFPFGSADEKTGEDGATTLLSKWLASATKRKDKAAFEQAKMRLGAELSTSISTHHTLVSVEAPSETFADAWVLALEMTREPRLRDSDVSAVRDVALTAIKSARSHWLNAGRMYLAAAIDAGSSDGRSALGTDEGLRAMTPKRLKAIYASTFARGPTSILVSETATPEHEKLMRETTADWTVASREENRRPYEPKGRSLVIIERPASTQAYLFIAKPGPFVGGDDFAFASVATELLGANGSAPSLLFDELRSKRGLTYHASMQITPLPGGGVMGVTFGANDNIAELASRYLETWSKFYESEQGIDALREAEVAYRTKRTRANSATFAAIFDAAAATLGLSGDVKPLWKNPEMSIQAVQGAKKKWLSPADFTCIVLGDSAKVRAPLEQALAPVRRTILLSADAGWDSVSAAVAAP